ncbi:M23 family metallopeptidase [Oceanispirochaeta crateris]|uniref:M23 family metallopeptidase n=1 Tax=Oceanispirochaeta crateris TaxID=2518645 RepID=A0A5C1QMB8_9SPIO|nr:M23 family metallopeptidase [Oceanispirochaeta crateris]QEN07302.1 M23 family metallopeptidase [Oceanispirochaeta crateris]
MKQLFLVLLVMNSYVVFGQYPLISETSNFRDRLFKQQQIETESWYYNEAQGMALPPLSIYRYKPKKGDTLIMLSAAFNLPLDTLATINGFENIGDFSEDKEILVPSAPGLYIYKDSRSSWMENLRGSLKDQTALTIILNLNNEKHEVDYYQGMTLSSQQRTRFVLPLFLSPLKERIITSAYGYRNHPVTGVWGLHKGTDYRASVGSPVFSCADGFVLSTGELEDYGKFIILQHKNGYTSMYSHLSKILVERNQRILEGVKIAETGNTGLSTGPHLHFEIRQYNKTVDPENLLLKGQE